MGKYIKLVIFVLFFLSCSSDGTKNRAFYYWQTRFDFSEDDKKTSNILGVNKLYIRYFDVDWSAMRKEAIPVGIVSFWDCVRFPEEFVPCIFITNTVMLKSTKDQLDTLAFRIFRKTNELSKSFVEQQRWSLDSSYVLKNKNIVENWHEIQIDCDWTEKSKDNYFYFLKSLKKMAYGKQISATVRLWQLKYKDKSGIPPVDKAMLMCYSTGNPRNYNIQNSIATYDELKTYIKGQKYPLPMDFALPIYNWTVLYRNRKFKEILRDFEKHVVFDDTCMFKPLAENRFLFKSDTVIGNTYLRYGDELRLESLKPYELEKLSKLLSESDLYSPKSTISFFSWDTLYIQKYGKENINSYFTNFPASN